MNYIIEEIKPRIFFLNFKNRYSMSLMFLRYQECYESQGKKFKNKSFTIIEFVEWYSKKYGNGNFCYVNDWSGFNIPGEVVTKVISLGIPDHNKYDDEMLKIYYNCLEKYPDNKFYLIASQGKGITMKHEIAHALFYINKEYKEKATKLVEDLNSEFKNKFFKKLKELKYCKEVLIDECQAYLSTGTYGFNLNIKKENKPFVKLFKEYYEKE